MGSFLSNVLCVTNSFVVCHFNPNWVSSSNFWENDKNVFSNAIKAQTSHREINTLKHILPWLLQTIFTNVTVFSGKRIWISFLRYLCLDTNKIISNNQSVLQKWKYFFQIYQICWLLKYINCFRISKVHTVA